VLKFSVTRQKHTTQTILNFAANFLILNRQPCTLLFGPTRSADWTACRTRQIYDNFLVYGGPYGRLYVEYVRPLKSVLAALPFFVNVSTVLRVWAIPIILRCSTFKSTLFACHTCQSSLWWCDISLKKRFEIVDRLDRLCVCVSGEGCVQSGAESLFRSFCEI
jgi:hypothetical protein